MYEPASPVRCRSLERNARSTRRRRSSDARARPSRLFSGTGVRGGLVLPRTKPHGPKNHAANAAASVRDHVHDLDDGDHGAMHQLCGGVTFVSSRRQSRAARSSLLLAWMYTIPRYGVVHLRFSIVFLPAATAQAHGCFSDRMRGPDCFVRAPAVW